MLFVPSLGKEKAYFPLVLLGSLLLYQRFHLCPLRRSLSLPPTLISYEENNYVFQRMGSSVGG